MDVKTFDPSSPLKSIKAEKVVLLVFEHPELSQMEIGTKVGFSSRTANVQVSRLLTRPQVAARLSWLMSQATSSSILSVIKRKEALSRIIEQIGGQDPADYLTADANGVIITFDKDSPNTMAVAGLKSKKEYGQGGCEVAQVTELKLRDPTIAIRAIDTLNRMDGLYQEDRDSQRVSVTLIVQDADGHQKRKIAGNSDYLPEREIEAPETRSLADNLRYMSG